MNRKLVKLISLITVIAFFVTAIGIISYSILAPGR